MKRLLVTGSAAGIGRSLAQRFNAEGWHVTGIDVVAAEARLASGREEGMHIQADLCAAAELERVLGILMEQDPFDAVIHNAGINSVAPFERSGWSEQEAVVALNLTAPMVLTGSLLERGGLSKRATVVFVSSLSHFVSYPGAAVYAATKDGLASYAASLQSYLEPRGGHVLTVYPGPTRTAHARRHSPDNSREERRMAPEELARRIHRAVVRRRRILVPGLSNHVFAAFGHLMPRLSERAMKKALYDKLPAPDEAGNGVA